jgi:hypothetical protein
MMRLRNALTEFACWVDLVISCRRRTRCLMEVVFCLLFSLPYSLVSQADVPLLFGHNHATAPGRLPRLTDDSRLRTRDGGDSNVRADDRSSNVQCVPAYPVFLELFLRAV